MRLKTLLVWLFQKYKGTGNLTIVDGILNNAIHVSWYHRPVEIKEFILDL